MLQLATCVVTALVTPVDVANSRLVAAASGSGQGPAKSPAAASSGGRLLQCWKDVLEEQGVGGLWTGVVPRVAKSGLSGAITFAVYEFTKAKL